MQTIIYIRHLLQKSTANCLLWCGLLIPSATDFVQSRFISHLGSWLQIHASTSHNQRVYGKPWEFILLTTFNIFIITIESNNVVFVSKSSLTDILFTNLPSFYFKIHLSNDHEVKAEFISTTTNSKKQQQKKIFNRKFQSTVLAH